MTREQAGDQQPPRFAVWLRAEDWEDVLSALNESGLQRIHEEITEQAEGQWPDDNEENGDAI